MAVETQGRAASARRPAPYRLTRESMSSETAYRDCLITVHGMLHDGHRARDLIKAALNDDPRAALRCRIGDARLTPREWDLLIAIDGYIAEHHMAPTQQELAAFFGISKVSVHEHINALLKKCVIGNQKHAARSLYIVDRRQAGAPA